MDFEWLKGKGDLELLVATLSEGFCPRCGQRLTQLKPFEHDQDDLEAAAFARGGCLACQHWLRAGREGSDPQRDWFSAVMRRTDGDLDGCVLTMTLNPPPDKEEDDDDDDW